MEFSSVPWEPDIAASECTLCHTKFNLVTRKSHCRACGHVICKKCAPNTNFVFAGDMQSRICVACEKLFTGKPPPAPVNRGRAGTQFEQSVKQLGGKVIGGGHRLLHLIKPGTPEQTGFPYRELSDETTSSRWESFEPFKGQFVFSTSPINDDEVLSKDKLLTHFSCTQEIYGRAIWPTAIRNYPLGGKKGQEPEYGPDFIAEWTPQCTANVLYLVLFLKIDGVPLIRRTHAKFGGNLCYFQTRGPVHPDWSSKTQPFIQDPDILDYYSFTCSIGCTLKPNIMNFAAQEEWDKAVPSLVVAFEELSLGVHTVELELCFLISSNPEEKIPPPNFAPEKALCQDTLMSYPIASGSFLYEVRKPTLEEKKNFSQTTSVLPSPSSSSSSTTSSSSSSSSSTSSSSSASSSPSPPAPRMLRPRPQYSATLPAEGMIGLSSNNISSPLSSPREKNRAFAAHRQPNNEQLNDDDAGGEQSNESSETTQEQNLEF